MDRLFLVKKAVETVTVQDLIATILYFRCAEWTCVNLNEPEWR